MGRLATLGLITIIILSTSASPAAAQFGALKRLKELKDAVSAMASNFRAADQVYLPIAGHFQGIKGETFVTDVALSNLSDDAVDVSIIFSTTAAGTPKTFPKALTLNPRERREVQDFFGTVLKDSNNQGLLIFNACKKDQDCTPQADGENPNYRNISIESRIYSTPAGTDPATAPTTGSSSPASPGTTSSPPPPAAPAPGRPLH